MNDPEVLNELMALHWSSHGKGATIPEIVGGLQVRGVRLPADQRESVATVWRILSSVPSAWHVAELRRDGWWVAVPSFA